MKIGFFGAGKVGFTLGKYFRMHGVEVTGYYSRSIQSAQEAADFTGTQAFAKAGDLTDASDVLFFTLPDGALRGFYEELRSETIQNKIFCHCSGALTARDAFPDIEQYGATGFSVHPLFAVSDKYHAYEELADVFFTLEGSEERLDFMEMWLKSLALKVKVVAPAVKVKYHCAAALASNYVIALLALSRRLLAECGFSPAEAERALMPLFAGNARHIAADGMVAALTGPVERGDLGTIRKHLDCLEPEAAQLYDLLAQELLMTAQAKNPARDYSSIKEFLLQSADLKGRFA
ncbi:Predicted oxidoreductase, contains short-chain dehydrogenase (SDR) and DUF2520 domains [Selenomonas ruminantium]|uniref:Predicted oxidoreductase, contains short-chain dehydrogenase (SDR) and DUF2520 domains n=1 Tax=Selenomonas ruminantium TaxID=971 RepID=A0A1M6SX98_SELRU|nr:Rossmann-like and DUF2520 domain-containing protein [Selenomonas ruminantium]SHK49341.1 Predicted oxidoreductase, contains short-chain dehydrogenase (SDR) and DUF2520 domains [Selenomonas ruminantium]